MTLTELLAQILFLHMRFVFLGILIAMLLLRVLLCSCILALGSQSAIATGAISGQAAVIDGDTIEIGDHQVRLLGIDAPEAAQEHKLDTGGTDFLGRGAAMMLRSLITVNEIRCDLSPEKDSRGLPLGTCFSGKTNLAAEMVASGMARATPNSPYAEAEKQAKSAKKGFWRDRSEAPWAFRERRLSAAAPKNSPGGCVFKAVSDGARKTLITPWSPWYNDVQVNLARGDRWFCSEAQAVSQGWYEPRWLIESVVSGVYNPTN